MCHIIFILVLVICHFITYYGQNAWKYDYMIILSFVIKAVILFVHHTMLFWFIKQVLNKKTPRIETECITNRQHCESAAKLVLQSLRHRAHGAVAHGTQDLAEERPFTFVVGVYSVHRHPLGPADRQGHPEAQQNRKVILLFVFYL